MPDLQKICSLSNHEGINCNIWVISNLERAYMEDTRECNKEIGSKLLLPKAAHYSWRWHTMFFSRTSPFPVRELCGSDKSFLGILYGWSDLWRILTSQKFKTYSRSWFDFPNTLVETREHHHEPWQFVNTLPRAVVLAVLYLAVLYSQCFSR
jgi:hypothetical protein